MFLNEPDSENKFKIMPYSATIPDGSMSGRDLIKGIEVRSLEKRLVLEQGQHSKFVLCLDSFFGYDENVPLRVSSFDIYDPFSKNNTSYEDPNQLEEFGIFLSTPPITAISDKTIAFDIPVYVKDEAVIGRYFINLEHQDANSFEWLYWKKGSIQLHIFLE